MHSLINYTDECETQPPVCGDNANCFNTHGSYYCHCNVGFTPTHNFTGADGIKCQDINECAAGSAVCGPNAECINTEGSYSCTCKTGYISSNGKEIFIAEQIVQCIDGNECDDPSVCGIYATCHNTPGSYYCICAEGFTLKSGETNFTDFNENCMSVCDIDTSICGGGTCTNSKDGQECACKSFTNYGHKQMKCTDINECADGSAVCGPNAECVNSEGSYSCTCEPGYISSNGQEIFIAEQGVQCIGPTISVLHILSSVLAACPYLLVTVVLIYKCCRMRVISVEEEDTSI
ncbi:adhesion G protein-coupled receptor E1 [Rhinichthys klamathensis goyatoka]|uniref:adhesion G protein-coupled receptor E1 n=1 Tax=Rhinichthys klamathensis goyatoka TaxID=3034132 RepID=UPI0024B5ED3F|nr:adhesion G protein-coupled receptor E1 [Rhinichthys klamathensis goyatoka]